MPPRESTSSVHPTLTVIRDALGWLLRLFRPIRQSVTPDRATEVDCSHFEAAIAKIAAGDKSWFITGAAGTGKSTLLRCLMRRLKHRAVFLAPTGLAALNVGGQTIHSFCRLPPQHSLIRYGLTPPHSARRTLFSGPPRESFTR